MEDKVIVKKVGQEYHAVWDSIIGTGKTHMEALHGLHYMINFFDGTVEKPQPIPVKDFEFADRCEDSTCPCNKTLYNYERHSHQHCWDQKQPPACGIALEAHNQCCLCDLKNDNLEIKK